MNDRSKHVNQPSSEVSDVPPSGEIQDIDGENKEAMSHVMPFEHVNKGKCFNS
jgi:hypothetical protein